MTAVDTMLRFAVYGHPQGKGSKRAVRGRVIDSNPNARPWALQVSAAAHDAYGDEPLIRGPVEVSMEFFFSRPKGHYGRRGGLLPSAPAEMTVPPDLDKLCRAAADALTGVVIKDDGQIAHLHLAKRYGEPERLEVRLREIA